MTEQTKPVEREALYEEVWKEPISVVASRYGLSDVGLAKICRKLAIPLPSRGYWAKVLAGRIMARAPLPKLEGSRLALLGPTKLSDESIASLKLAREVTNQTREMVEKIVLTALPKKLSHPLVLAAKKRLNQKTGWGERGVRSAPREVLNIAVTESALDRALLISDALLSAVERLGFEVRVDSNDGKTLIRCKENGVDVEFLLKESVKRTVHEVTPEEQKTREKYSAQVHTNIYAKPPNIPYYDFTPSGILTLEVGRWPTKTWKDTPRERLEQRIPDLALGIVLVARDKYANEQELKRRQLIHQRAKEKFELITKLREEELERFRNLEASATNWERAKKLRAFADAFEQQELQKGNLTSEHLDWLAWVRAKADGLDPLTLVSDPVLNAPELN